MKTVWEILIWILKNGRINWAALKDNKFVLPLCKPLTLVNMKQDELLALINAKIAGQGNQIDLGGALAEILSAVAGAALPLEVADITALTDEQLDALNVGDKVAKKTGTAQHLYVVSYKDAENGGLCLTYTDAANVETVSYDHTESGWAYNSTDKTPIAQ